MAGSGVVTEEHEVEPAQKYGAQLTGSGLAMFSKYAGKDLNRWKELIGQKLWYEEQIGGKKQIVMGIISDVT